MRILYFFVACLLTATLSAQTVNYDKVVLPVETRPATFEDLLVQLAWQNSAANRVLELEKDIVEKEARLNRLKWTENVQAGFNLNEVSYYNIINPDEENFVAFPLYTLNASISLNTLLTQETRKEIGKLKVLQADADINQAKLDIRLAVLKAYADYLAAVETLKNRTNATEELRATHKMSAQLFKEDKINYEEFTNIGTSYFNSREQAIHADAALTIAMRELEALIGIDWEMAETYRARYDN